MHHRAKHNEPRTRENAGKIVRILAFPVPSDRRLRRHMKTLMGAASPQSSHLCQDAPTAKITRDNFTRVKVVKIDDRLLRILRTLDFEAGFFSGMLFLSSVASCMAPSVAT